MTVETRAVVVHILDKEYRVACPEADRDALLTSVQLLNRKMKEIRDGGRVVGTERIAVMAALNMANELLEDSRSRNSFMDSVSSRIRVLQEKVESALVQGSPAES